MGFNSAFEGLSLKENPPTVGKYVLEVRFEFNITWTYRATFRFKYICKRKAYNTLANRRFPIKHFSDS